MYRLFRTAILTLLLIATAYFAVCWIGSVLDEDFIYRPLWIHPGIEEPLTILCGVISGIVALWERMIENTLKTRSSNLERSILSKPKELKDTFLVNILHSKLTITKRIQGLRNIFSSVLDVQFHIENLDGRVVGIKDMSVFVTFKEEVNEFRFARIYQYSKIYQKEITVDPRPGLIITVEGRANNTYRARFQQQKDGYGYKDHLTEALQLRIKILNGMEHNVDFNLS